MSFDRTIPVLRRIYIANRNTRDPAPRSSPPHVLHEAPRPGSNRTTTHVTYKRGPLHWTSARTPGAPPTGPLGVATGG